MYCDVTGKTIHATPNAARKGVTRQDRKSVGRPYRCEFCHGYHITHVRGEILPKWRWKQLAFGE